MCVCVCVFVSCSHNESLATKKSNISPHFLLLLSSDFCRLQNNLFSVTIKRYTKATLRQCKIGREVLLLLLNIVVLMYNSWSLVQHNMALCINAPVDILYFNANHFCIELRCCINEK